MTVLGGVISKLRRLATEYIYFVLNMCHNDGFDEGFYEKALRSIDVFLAITCEFPECFEVME